MNFNHGLMPTSILYIIRFYKNVLVQYAYATVKVHWDGRERRSCASDHWQIAILQLQVRKNAHER